MTNRLATPPDIASRVWIVLHEFIAGRERQVGLDSSHSIFGRRLRSPANRIRQI
jgi:hypothetical protein